MVRKKLGELGPARRVSVDPENTGSEMADPIAAAQAAKLQKRGKACLLERILQQLVHRLQHLIPCLALQRNSSKLQLWLLPELPRPISQQLSLT